MIGGFKTEDGYGMDSDWDVRANLAGVRWAYIDEPLYHYRRHQGQTVIKRSGEWYCDQQRRFLNEAKPFWTNPFNPTRHIEVMVTGRCNQACKYCSQATFNRDHRDYQATVESIAKLCERAKAIGARYEWLQFSGGEPLLWDNLEQACQIARGTFQKIRVFSNCCDTGRMDGLLKSGLVDAVYTNSTNASPSGWTWLKDNWPDKAIVAPLTHKPLPTAPLPGVLPARCNCDHPSVIGENVYPCGNFYEHTHRLPQPFENYKDYYTTLDSDWISFFRRVDRFSMPICAYCLANGKVWEKI